VIRSDLPVLLARPPALIVGRTGEERSFDCRGLLRPRTLALLATALVVSMIVAEAQSQGAATRPGILATLWLWTPVVFGGFLFNLLTSVLSMALGTAAGLLLGLALISLVRPVSRSAWYVTQFFRNAPWLVLLFYCMLLLPFEVLLFGQTVSLPAWLKASVGLALPVMANVAEIVRGGVQSIPDTQWQAADSLAFTRLQTIRMIILPQCLKRMTPPWMNLYAILTMATTLISIVGVQEGLTLTRAALVADGRVELFVPMYLMLLMFFFLYCYPIARWTIALERRFNVKA
jgi:polar amino acid transport system permease protein